MFHKRSALVALLLMYRAGQHDELQKAVAELKQMRAHNRGTRSTTRAEADSNGVVYVHPSARARVSNGQVTKPRRPRPRPRAGPGNGKQLHRREAVQCARSAYSAERTKSWPGSGSGVHRPAASALATPRSSGVRSPRPASTAAPTMAAAHCRSSLIAPGWSSPTPASTFGNQMAPAHSPWASASENSVKPSSRSSDRSVSFTWRTYSDIHEIDMHSGYLKHNATSIVTEQTASAPWLPPRLSPQPPPPPPVEWKDPRGPQHPLYWLPPHHELIPPQRKVGSARFDSLLSRRREPAQERVLVRPVHEDPWVSLPHTPAFRGQDNQLSYPLILEYLTSAEKQIAETNCSRLDPFASACPTAPSSHGAFHNELPALEDLLDVVDSAQEDIQRTDKAWHNSARGFPLQGGDVNFSSLTPEEVFAQPTATFNSRSDHCYSSASAIKLDLCQSFDSLPDPTVALEPAVAAIVGPVPVLDLELPELSDVHSLILAPPQLPQLSLPTRTDQSLPSSLPESHSTVCMCGCRAPRSSSVQILNTDSSSSLPYARAFSPEYVSHTQTESPALREVTECLPSKTGSPSSYSETVSFLSPSESDSLPSPSETESSPTPSETKTVPGETQFVSSLNGTESLSTPVDAYDFSPVPLLLKVSGASWESDQTLTSSAQVGMTPASPCGSVRKSCTSHVTVGAGPQEAFRPARTSQPDVYDVCPVAASPLHSPDSTSNACTPCTRNVDTQSDENFFILHKEDPSPDGVSHGDTHHEDLIHNNLVMKHLQDKDEYPPHNDSNHEDHHKDSEHEDPHDDDSYHTVTQLHNSRHVGAEYDGLHPEDLHLQDSQHEDLHLKELHHEDSQHVVVQPEDTRTEVTQSEGLHPENPRQEDSQHEDLHPEDLHHEDSQHKHPRHEDHQLGSTHPKDLLREVSQHESPHETLNPEDPRHKVSQHEGRCEDLRHEDSQHEDPHCENLHPDDPRQEDSLHEGPHFEDLHPEDPRHKGSHHQGTHCEDLNSLDPRQEGSQHKGPHCEDLHPEGLHCEDLIHLKDQRHENSQHEVPHCEDLRHEDSQHEDLHCENMHPKDPRHEGFRHQGTDCEDLDPPDPRPEDSQQEGPHCEDLHPKGLHCEDVHTEDPRHEDLHHEGPHCKDLHPEDARHEDSLHESPHCTDVPDEDSHQEGSHCEDLLPEDLRHEDSLHEGPHCTDARHEDSHQEGSHCEDLLPEDSRHEDSHHEGPHCDNLRPVDPRLEDSQHVPSSCLAELSLHPRRGDPNVPISPTPSQADTVPVSRSTSDLTSTSSSQRSDLSSSTTATTDYSTTIADSTSKELSLCHLCGHMAWQRSQCDYCEPPLRHSTDRQSPHRDPQPLFGVPLDLSMCWETNPHIASACRSSGWDSFQGPPRAIPAKKRRSSGSEEDRLLSLMDSGGSCGSKTKRNRTGANVAPLVKSSRMISHAVSDRSKSIPNLIPIAYVGQKGDGQSRDGEEDRSLSSRIVERGPSDLVPVNRSQNSAGAVPHRIENGVDLSWKRLCSDTNNNDGGNVDVPISSHPRQPEALKRLVHNKCAVDSSVHPEENPEGHSSRNQKSSRCLELQVPVRRSPRLQSTRRLAMQPSARPPQRNPATPSRARRPPKVGKGKKTNSRLLSQDRPSSPRRIAQRLNCPVWNCPWTDCLEELRAHLLAVHPQQIEKAGVESQHTILVLEVRDKGHMTFIQEVNQEMFVIGVHSIQSGLYATIQLVESGRPVVVKGILETLSRGGTALRWQGAVPPVWEDHQVLSARGDCLQINIQDDHEFEEHVITINVRIQVNEEFQTSK